MFSTFKFQALGENFQKINGVYVCLRKMKIFHEHTSLNLLFGSTSVIYVCVSTTCCHKLLKWHISADGRRYMHLHTEYRIYITHSIFCHYEIYFLKSQMHFLFPLHNLYLNINSNILTLKLD